MCPAALAGFLADVIFTHTTPTAASVSLPPAKGTLPWREDVTIIGWIHEAIVSVTVLPMIASCVHRITHIKTDRRYASMNVVLIMPSGWKASGGVGVCGSQRTYWVVRQQRQKCLLCRLNLARSRQTDLENGYENRSPIFSYERSPISTALHNTKYSTDKVSKVNGNNNKSPASVCLISRLPLTP